MATRTPLALCLCLCGPPLAVLGAADVSIQQSEVFLRKMALVAGQGDDGLRPSAGARRTPFTEIEVNSWFAFHGQDILPAGVTDARVTILGEGRIRGAATVDLDAIAKRRTSRGGLDPWSYLSGRLPVTVGGVLRTRDGVGRFELEEAAISGIPVPPALLQDVVSYYSRTPDDPRGVRLDETFALPSGIRLIEVGRGQAVVVQ